MIIVGFVILCLGIFFMIYYKVHKKQNNRRTARVQGTCVNITVNTSEDSGDTTHYDFSYDVGGNQYMLKNLIVPGSPAIGDQVTLRYNPDNPKDAGYDFASDGKEKYILYVGIGITVVGIILMIL